MAPVSEEGEEKRGDTCAAISPAAGACQRAPLPPVPILFTVDAQVRFTLRPDTLYNHAGSNAKTQITASFP